MCRKSHKNSVQQTEHNNTSDSDLDDSSSESDDSELSPKISSRPKSWVKVMLPQQKLGKWQRKFTVSKTKQAVDNEIAQVEKKHWDKLVQSNLYL